MSSRCTTCLTFGDFKIVQATDSLYVNAAQVVNVTCPNGTTTTYAIAAGTIGYVLQFQLGTPPYPDLTLNCTGGQISIPVPDNTTQAQLEQLINQLLNSCAAQVATQLGCADTGAYLNTQQQWQPNSNQRTIVGAVASGIGIDSTGYFVIVNSGLVSSSVSQADANGKALQLAYEAFFSGNVI